jgi:hypothetical protein
MVDLIALAVLAALATSLAVVKYRIRRWDRTDPVRQEWVR